MKLLVLTADYPRLDGTHERMYVHVRNLYYVKQGFSVTVLNFATNFDYEIDGILVLSLRTYENKYGGKKGYFDIVLSHASNIRNHYRFLRKHEMEFEKIVFFFHGHEMLYLNKSYPKPYFYVKNKVGFTLLQNCYDAFKIRIWKTYYKKLAEKSYYIFVSHWIKKSFQINTGLSDADLLGHCYVINNSVGHVFEVSSYDLESEKKYDYITIRSHLDGSKYCIDLITELAKRNSERKFLLIGRGKFFKYNKKPDNVYWIDCTLDQEEMLKYLDMSRCGLLLTRQDTQGVMTCEFATYGIPVITSDIEVCHEIFDEMPNVAFIDNSLDNADITKISRDLKKGIPYLKNKKYFEENTISKEVSLFRNILS